jgi:hypothetical protein
MLMMPGGDWHHHHNPWHWKAIVYRSRARDMADTEDHYQQYASKSIQPYAQMMVR